MAANTRPAAVRERCRAWVPAGSGATSSKAASGTRARTARSAPSRWPPWVARTPSVSAPQLARPARAVVRPRPMPAVPAPWRAVVRTRRSASAMRSTCSAVPPMTVSSAAPSIRSTTAAASSPRAEAWTRLLPLGQPAGEPGHQRGRDDERDQQHRAGAGEQDPHDGHGGAPDQGGDREGLDDPEHDVLE